MSDAGQNGRVGDTGPVCWWSEALHGYGRMGRATIYPQAIGLAATWDPALIKKIGDATGDEARGRNLSRSHLSDVHGIILWSPTVNLVRDPRWGRVEETYGEDPWLASRIAVAYVQGLQGDDPKYLKTVATPKHFAVYSEETGRVRVDAEVSERAARLCYLAPFRACFVEGKAASTMAAYNAINGVSRARQWLAADGSIAERLGIQWGGGFGFQHGFAIGERAEDCVDGRPGGGGGAQCRAGCDFGWALESAGDSAGGGESPASPRGAESCGGAEFDGAVSAGDVRSAGDGAVFKNIAGGDWFEGTCRAGAGGGAGIDCAAQE